MIASIRSCTGHIFSGSSAARICAHRAARRSARGRVVGRSKLDLLDPAARQPEFPCHLLRRHSPPLSSTVPRPPACDGPMGPAGKRVQGTISVPVVCSGWESAGNHDVVGLPGGLTAPVDASFHATVADPAVFFSVEAVTGPKPVGSEIRRRDGLKLLQRYGLCITFCLVRLR